MRLPKNWVARIKTLTLEKHKPQYYQPITKYNYARSDLEQIVVTSGHAPRYYGGIKLNNIWVKLLRKHGFDSKVATVDGQYD